jgi:hypothetical protein
MKIIIITPLLLLIGTLLGFPQVFTNLDFSSANIPSGTPQGSMVPASEAIPGWIGYLGNTQQTSVLYDNLFIGSAAIAILDTNWGGVIPGNNFTVALQAGASGSGNVSASIAQTGLIPSTARSILFEASLPYAAGWQVTIAGQNIPVTQISAIDSYNGVYAGDVSAYSGKVANLEFTALSGGGPTVNLYLDSISFSTSIIPEPSTFGLFALAGLLFSLRRWRSQRNLPPG